MVYRGLLLADMHFGATDPDVLKQEIRDNILNVIDTKIEKGDKLDYLIILGDYWDKKMYLNNKAITVGMWFMNILSQYFNKIRIVYGTESHESDQYHVFDVFKTKPNLDFAVIKTVEEEELLPGLNVLYLPEEYILSKDDYYSEYFGNKKKYNYIFGHGNIAEVMTMVKRDSNKKESRLKPPTFTTADFKKCCKGEVYFGHYHVHSNIDDWVYYVGSFTRWIHGEEEEKGFYEIIYDTESKEYSNIFHENYSAPLYKIYSFGYNHDIFKSPDMLDNNIKTLMNIVNSGKYHKLKFRFNIPEDYPNPELFMDTMREVFKYNDSVSFDFVNGYVAKKKSNDEKAISEIVDKYDYVFDKSLSVGDKVNNFIKETDNRDIGGDKINTYLNTAVMKLIEDELEESNE